MTEIIPSTQNAITSAGAVGDLLTAWRLALQLRVNAGELAATSAAGYVHGVQKFLTWCEAGHVGNVGPDDLRAWKADLLTEGKKPATVNAWLAGVRSLYGWAVEYGRMDYNPALFVKGASRKGTNKKHAREALTDIEVMRVLQAAKGSPRDHAILSLMVYTGVRTVEVHRADLANLRTEGGRLVLYVTGKGHDEDDELVVIANAAAQNALYDWIAQRGTQPGPLFTSLSDRNKGERLGLHALRVMVKHYYQLAGVQGNKTTHSLRHTAITKVIDNGGTIRQAQTLARHKSQATTEIYIHERERLTNPPEELINYGE